MRILSHLALLILAINAISYYSFAATLDDLYKPLLKENKFLYEAKSYFFRLDERGVHGAAAFDSLDAEPHFLNIENTLVYSPLSSLNIALRYSETLHTDYNRNTYNPTGALTAVNEYEIDYFRDYTVSLRNRVQAAEIFLDFTEKRQRTRWAYAPFPAPANTFTFMRAHYEDLRLGVKSIFNNKESLPKSNLSKITRPLLDNGQSNMEIALGYKEGTLRRNTSWHSATGLFNWNYYHILEPHFISELILRYGLLDGLELESGLTYTTPFEYKYSYREFRPNGISLFIDGSYKLEDNFFIPLRVRYRPKDNFEIGISSDLGVIKQTLDSQQKNVDNTVSNFPSRVLTYYNIQPTITLTYLHDKGKEIKEDDFSKLTKNLLQRNQYLIKCELKQDITHLSKNSDNQSQNIIDPYNVFLYPLDLFVAGSEYAAFNIGNTSGLASNIEPQDFFSLKADLNYGITDYFNIGLGGGYRTTSKVDHFTIFDRRKRNFKFESYYFLDTTCDWRIFKDSMLSLKAHIVPDYSTIMDRERDPKQYESKNNYFDIALSFKLLF